MIGLLWFVLAILVSPFRSKARLEAEIAMLRQTAPSLRSLACGSTERPPALAGRSVAPVSHVLRDSGLSDLEAKLQKLAMNARRAPERVIQAHLADQYPQLRVDPRAPALFLDFHRQ